MFPSGDFRPRDGDNREFSDKPRGEFGGDRENAPRSFDDKPRYSNKPKGGKPYGKPSGGRGGGYGSRDKPFKKSSQPYAGKRDFDRSYGSNKRKDGRR